MEVSTRYPDVHPYPTTTTSQSPTPRNTLPHLSTSAPHSNNLVPRSRLGSCSTLDTPLLLTPHCTDPSVTGRLLGTPSPTTGGRGAYCGIGVATSKLQYRGCARSRWTHRARAVHPRWISPTGDTGTWVSGHPTHGLETFARAAPSLERMQSQIMGVPVTVSTPLSKASHRQLKSTYDPITNKWRSARTACHAAIPDAGASRCGDWG